MASQKLLKKKSCLFSVSVYGWRLYQVDAINQFRHMIKTKGLKRPINLFRCVPCPTFTTHFSSSIYVGLNSAPSLSSVLFVVFRIFSHLHSIQSSNTLLSFAINICLLLSLLVFAFVCMKKRRYVCLILSPWLRLSHFVFCLSYLYLSLWPGASMQYPCHGCASSN